MKTNFTLSHKAISIISLFFFILQFHSLTRGQPWMFEEVAVEQNLMFIHDHGGSGEKYYVETMGSGVCLFDYDNDHDLDLYFCQGASLPGWNKKIKLENKLFRNDGGQWTDVTTIAGVGDKSYSIGCACGDADNDGDTDLYVTNFGNDIFYRNNGDGTFTDISKTAGRFEDALRQYELAESLEPDSWLPHYKKGVVLYYLSRLDEANSSLKTALNLSPNNGSVYHFLGLAALANHHLDSAKIHLDKAVIFDSKNPDVWFHLGQAHMRGEDWSKAKMNLLRAHSMAPNHSETLYSLGQVFNHLGDKENAKKFLNKFKNISDFQEGAETIKKKIQGKPQSGDLRFELGTLYEKQGLAEDALVYYYQAEYLGMDEAIIRIQHILENHPTMP